MESRRGNKISLELSIERLYPLCHLPFTVVVEAIVASESDEASEANTQGEKDLRGSVDPYLKERIRKSTKILFGKYRG